jgi:hypothetical protein
MKFARVRWLALSAFFALWPGVASAYRPFDGTDAAVADPGELEIELQPAGVRRTDDQKTLIARLPSSTTASLRIGNWCLKVSSKRRCRHQAYPI